METQFRFARYLGCVMVGYCTLLHLAWAAMISIDLAALGATPIAALFDVFREDRGLLVAVLLVSSASALVAILMPLPVTVTLMLPQQGLLLMSATGAVFAICASQYADGVVRPRPFIAADQVHIVLAAFGHAVAMIALTYAALRERMAQI